MKQLIKPNLSETFADYNKAVKSFIYTERGHQLESLVRQQVNKQCNMRFSKDTLKRASFDLFDICGISDGFDFKAEKIIEIKTRSSLNRLTNENSISPTEAMQCMCYMKLNDCKKCLFVEHGPNGEQRMQELVFDEDEFEQLIVKRLRAFVLKYKSMSKQEFLCLIAKYPNSFNLN